MNEQEFLLALMKNILEHDEDDKYIDTMAKAYAIVFSNCEGFADDMEYKILKDKCYMVQIDGRVYAQFVVVVTDLKTMEKHHVAVRKVVPEDLQRHYTKFTGEVAKEISM